MNKALEKKIEYSINLMQKSERIALKFNPDGFYIAFSGGKDSQVLYHLAKESGVKSTAITNKTPQLAYARLFDEINGK